MYLQDLNDLEAARDHLLKHPEAFSDLIAGDRRSDILCEMVLRVDATMMAHIPHQTPYLCLAAKEADPELDLNALIRDDHACALLLERVNYHPAYRDLLSPEICLRGLAEDGLLLRYVADQTEAMCLKAVQQNWRSIQHVDHVSLEVFKAGLSQSLEVRDWVDMSQPEFMAAVVQQDPWELMYMNDPPEAVCVLALQQAGGILGSIEKQTLAMCVAAASNDPKAVEFASLPADRLMVADSHQLSDWLQVIQACQGRLGPGVYTVHQLFDRIPFGKQYRDEWCQPVDPQRCLLDLATELSNELLRLAPEDNRVQRFAHKVRRQAEYELCQDRERPDGRTAPGVDLTGPL